MRKKIIILLGGIIGVILGVLNPAILSSYYIILFLLSVFLGTALVVLISLFLQQFIFFGAPYVPSNDTVVKNMLFLSKVQPHERVADLGCGDGKILFAFAKKGAGCHGFEINPILVFITKIRIYLSDLKQKPRVYLKSFWKKDLGSYDIITIYGISYIMPTLEKKLLRKKGKKKIRVLSNKFTFPNLKYKKKRGDVYLYVI